MPRYPCIRQHDETDCGAAVLASVARHYGLSIDLARLRDLAHTDRGGTNLLGLAEAAEAVGFLAKGVGAELEALDELPLPVVAHFLIDRLGHFVVVYRIKRDRLLVADPASGLGWMSKEEFAEKWTGFLLLLVPSQRLEGMEGKRSALGRLVEVARPHKALLFEAVLCAIFYTVLGLGFSFYVRLLVDQVLAHHDLRLLHLLGVGMVVLILFRTLFGALRQYLAIHIAMKMDVLLLLQYYRHVIGLPMRFFDTRKVGEILSRMSDVAKIRAAVSNVVLTVVVDALLVVVSLGVMFACNWRLAVIASVFVPLFLLSMLAFQWPLRRAQRGAMQSAADAEAYAVESLSGIAEIKAKVAQRQTAQKAESLIVRTMRKAFRSAMLALGSHTVGSLLAAAAALAMLWYGGARVIAGDLSLGQLMFFYTLLGYTLGPMERLVDVNTVVQEALVAADRLSEVLDLHREGVTRPSQLPLDTCRGEIEFRNVTFRYGNREPALEEVSLRIEPGDTVAAVGPSGSGKTTLANLILRFYEPQQGQVLLDRTDVRDIDLASLRRRVGLVPQTPFFFSGTVLENIRLGDPLATMAEVRDAAQAADLHEFVSSLPERYDTYVGERGVTLSGGQRQRLAIARVLLAKPDVLIVDEGLSALDPASEHAIQTALKELRQGRTTIVIAHRLTSVRDADRILVLSDGALVEQGRHEELLENKGLYSTLWNQQMQT